ncbi:MAG: histidine phosphatase family protein [Actinomycetota bacterium]|nr:histidine phosphatase family protein [Actinomycetota bacterium]
MPTRARGRRPTRDGAPLLSRRRRLVLLRHGRTAWNAAGRFQGQLDPPLDDVGRGQALAVSVGVADLAPTALVSSDSQRALATAAPLGTACRLPVTPLAGLREIHLGSWQGLTGDQAAAAYPSEFADWLAGLDVRRGSGETYAEVAARAVAALREPLTQIDHDGVLVAVTHGGTARAVLGSLLGLPVETWWRLAPLGNARWSVLVEADRGWRLGEHNAAGDGRVSSGLQISAPDVEPVKSGSPEGV